MQLKLTHSPLDQLKALKLDGMVDAFVELQNQQEASDLTRGEWLALLFDCELALAAPNGEDHKPR